VATGVASQPPLGFPVVMPNTDAQNQFTRLRAFRQQAYQLFHHRRDAFFELMDAVIETPGARSFAELSLAPAFTRKWHSLYKALDEVSYDQQLLDELCLAQIPTKQVVHFALDVTTIRRMHSPTLKDRLYCHAAKREVGGRGVIIGLPYSILAWASKRGSSFTPAVNIGRLKPLDKAVAVAVEQILWLGFYAPSILDWRCALDGAYGNREFFAPLQEKAVQVVARTRKDRVFYRRAQAEEYGGRGRPAVFGEAFRCKDASTWGLPDEQESFDDDHHGQVELKLWRALGFRRKGKFIEVEVMRSQIHAEKEKPPEAHWYVAYNGKPEQEISVRDWYETIVHRWGIEPANRFRKERLYAELAKVREAQSSDHWLMGVQLLEWQLYLGRQQVQEKCLPWQKEQEVEKRTPNRVIQSLPENLWQVGTPVGEVRERGKGRGWPVGKPRERPQKYKLEAKSRKPVARMAKKE
jgi:hypothetical protein